MKISRGAILPQLPSRPTCPAASVIAGAIPAESGVVCGVMVRAKQREQGLDMNPAQLQVAREGTGGAFLTLKSDPKGVERLCCGDGPPVLHDGEHDGNRETYTFCPVWQAEKARIWAGSDLLTEENLPDPVSYGVDEDAGGDPWEHARRDLDLLDPRG